MSAHECKICKLEQRELIEEWRFKQGLSYRQIQEKAANDLSVKLSQGLITKHFQFATDDVAQAVNSQIKEFVKTKAVDSMGVAAENITLAENVIGQLMPDGALRNRDAVGDLVMLMRERRQSAELILKYSGAEEDTSKDRVIKITLDADE